MFVPRIVTALGREHADRAFVNLGGSSDSVATRRSLTLKTAM